jgi:hypothetical protein
MTMIELSPRLINSACLTSNVRGAALRNTPQGPLPPSRFGRRAFELLRAPLSVLGLVACLFAMSDAMAFRLYTVGGDAACSFADLQQAIDAATDIDGNTVLVAQNLTYSNQHVLITDRTVNILGGLAECSSSDYIGQTTIHGTSGHSVIEIGGDSNVYIANLFITGATADASQSGGGIYFGGQGSLTLANSTVSLNSAGYGGGIDVNGSSGPATLTLDGETLILNNTAQTSGGGIRLEGNARLFALQPQTLIAFNHAPNGFGGGIEVVGPARADIGSPGYNGGAVIQFNDAEYGGGIAAAAPEQENLNAWVRVFTTDASHPVQVSNNTASHTGGGIWLRPWQASFPSKGTSYATLCAFDFRIENNIAQEGAAIYADTAFAQGYYPEGGDVYLNTDPWGTCSLPEAPPVLGAVACAEGVPCNTVSGNVAEDSGGTPTPGSAILVQTAGDLVVNRLLMRGNQGAHAIRTFGPDPDTGDASVQNCLIADNQSTGELVRIDDDGNLARPTGFVNCTFANNSIGGDTVIYSGHDLGMADMIFDQPGVPTLAYDGDPANLLVSYVLTNSNGTLPSQPDIVVGRPTYVDEAAGDYHLVAASLGVDFAPAAGGADLDRLPHDVDLSEVADTYGPRDLGAYEIQRTFACGAADTIFCAGFEVE